MKSTIPFVMLSVLSGLLFWAGASVADQSAEPSMKQEGMQLPKGVIGVSLDVSAERIGDPAILYVAMVNPEGPAHRAGLAHGDEIQAVGRRNAGRGQDLRAGRQNDSWRAGHDSQAHSQR